MIVELIRIFKSNFMLYLLIIQFMLKGFLFYGIFNYYLYPIFQSLNIPRHEIEAYYVMTYSPWMFKPLYGLLIDCIIMFAHKKRCWQIMMVFASLFASILFLLNNYNTVAIVCGFFIMNLVISVLDIVADSTYTTIMLNNPSTGSKIVCYIVMLQQFGILFALTIISQLVVSDYINIIFSIIASILIISISFSIFNLINSDKLDVPFILCIDKFVIQDKWMVTLSIYLVVYSIAYIILVHIYKNIYYTTSVLGSMYAILLLLLYVTYNKRTANVLLYVLIYNVLNPNFSVQLQYYYVNDSLNDNYTLYVSLIGTVAVVSGIVGSFIYALIFSNYSFRDVMLTTNILNISTSVITIIILELSDDNIYLIYFLSILWAITFGLTSIQQLTWITTYFSKCCVPGKETLMLATFTGIYNLSLVLGAMVTNYYYHFYLSYIGSLDNLQYFYAIAAFTLPLLLTLLLKKLISTETEKDNFIE